MPSSGRLANRTAIVTGASSGIGRAIARRFAVEGAHVVIADVTEEPVEGGEPTRKLIENAGGEANFISTDVSVWAQVDALVSQTVSRYGRLDVLVNNAAIYSSTPLTETREEDWDRVLEVNLKGAFLCAKRAVQQMLTQEIVGEVRGRLVNVSSQHGMVCAPNDIAYGVSKAGVAYITRQIAVDYAKHHIVCNAVAPGKILTGKKGPAIDPEALSYSGQRTPMPRLGRPDDVAAAALFLASDECSFTTGVNLMVDGGWMAG
ncbi:MAG TPA: glucose 1-dehydrogenase [Gammaproteobacteria bacterium]|nr:glucose 1-dehydrogenase [Gammaproteobacteria bacterium]